MANEHTSPNMESTQRICRQTSHSNMKSGFRQIIIMCFLFFVCAGAVEDTQIAGITNPSSTPITTNQPKTSWEPVLTPWWDLTFGDGEQLEVDCGVPTGEDPSSVTMTWTGPGGKPLKALFADRVKLNQWDKKQTAKREYAVLTFTLTNLTVKDAGVYTCIADKMTNTDNQTKTINITLTVMDHERRCGFEGSSLCGWTIGTNGNVTWHVHDADDNDVINRTKGTHFDHTYGASKHVGHFMDVDVKHHDSVSGNSSARLLSPLYSPHTEYRCLQFWYIFEGRDQVNMKISIHHANESDDVLTNVWKTDKMSNDWRLGTVTISPQQQDYHLVVDATVCSDRCTLAATAIDDVMITNGKCNNDTHWPSNSLRARLMGGSIRTEGRVEVLHDGQWGTICSEQFGQKEATVICGSLGYGTEYALSRRNAPFVSSPETLRSVIWLEKLACTGKESDLARCIPKGEMFGDTDCTHQEDAGVICSDVPLMSQTTTTKAPTTKMATTSTLAPSKPTPPAPSTPSSSLPTATSSPTPAPVAPSTTISSTTASTVTVISVPSNNSRSPTSSSSTSTKKAAPTPVMTTHVPDSTSAGPHYVKPTTHRSKIVVSTKNPTKTTPVKTSSSPERTNPDIVSLPPEVESYATRSNAGVAIGVIFALLIAATGVGILLYKRRRKGKKSTYITFGNPSYSREHLPANDFSLESPLTLSSNGYTVLA